MSDSDSFIQEVTEELKRDRMLALWKRYGVFVIALLVLLVVGAAGNSWWKHHKEQQARDASAALMAAADLKTPEEQAKAYQELAQKGEAPLVARFRAAAAYVAAGDTAKALDILDAIAANGETDRVYSDLAALKAIDLRTPTQSPDKTIEQLGPLTEEGRPYRLLALEARAAAYISAGEQDKARTDLQTIMGDQFVTNELRQRVTQLLAALGPAAES